MLIFWSVCDDACQWVLNALKFVEICLWDPRVKWIAVVKFAGDKWICKCCHSTAVAAERGRRWRIRRMSRMWKWQDLDRELIWSEKDMSESKMKPRLRAEELTGMISFKIRKFETLLFCLQKIWDAVVLCQLKKKFSFRWISKLLRDNTASNVHQKYLNHYFHSQNASAPGWLCRFVPPTFSLT